MPRPANKAKTVYIRVSTTPQVQEYLERLVAQGTFGKNVADAAQRLIEMKLNEMMGPARLADVLMGRSS